VAGSCVSVAGSAGALSLSQSTRAKSKFAHNARANVSFPDRGEPERYRFSPSVHTYTHPSYRARREFWRVQLQEESCEEELHEGNYTRRREGNYTRRREGDYTRRREGDYTRRREGDYTRRREGNVERVRFV
jgi:hypothetical protein